MSLALGQYMTPGFPGMKSSAENDNVQTLKSVADTAPGLITHSDATQQYTALPSAVGSVPAGLVLFDGEYQYQRAFQAPAVAGNVPGAKLPVNVLKKGRGWATVSTAGGATVTPGAVVKYSVDGTVSDQGALTLPGAIFKTGIITPTTPLLTFDTAAIAEIEMNTMLAGATPVA
jgi:hypothetical protein